MHLRAAFSEAVTAPSWRKAARRRAWEGRWEPGRAHPGPGAPRGAEGQPSGESAGQGRRAGAGDVASEVMAGGGGSEVGGMESGDGLLCSPSFPDPW